MTTAAQSAEFNIATLQQALEAWRVTAKAKSKAIPSLENNPYGSKIHALNTQWSKTKAEHDAKIQDAKDAYLAERARLTQLSAEYKARTPKRPRGRTSYGDYSPEVKIAAYRVSITHNRGMVRTILGTQDTAKLNRVLDEGKALHEAGEAATGTDGGW